MKGVLITFEGTEGCGKTTQARMLFDYLQERSYRVFFSREPGATSIGKKIRDLVLNKEYEGIKNLTETFLYLADRAQHVETIVKPHLEDGVIVISDRFADSTLIYQGYGRGIDKEFIKKANRVATQSIVPDITFIIDLDVTTGLKRAAAVEKENSPAGKLDRIEGEVQAFHEKLRQGFKSLAKLERRRCKLLDGRLDVHEIQKVIRSEVHTLLKRRKIYSANN